MSLLSYFQEINAIPVTTRVCIGLAIAGVAAFGIWVERVKAERDNTGE